MRGYLDEFSCQRDLCWLTIPNVIQESVNGNVGASDLQQATPMAKQTMCEHMVDAASCKGEDAGAASSRLLKHVRYMAKPQQAICHLFACWVNISAYTIGTHN